MRCGICGVAPSNPKLAGFGAVFGGGMVAVYFSLHHLVVRLLGVTPWNNPLLNSAPGLVVLALLLGLFLLVLALQTELPHWAGRPWFQALYVHARNGFYFNTLANRAVAALWLLKPQTLKSSSHEHHA